MEQAWTAKSLADLFSSSRTHSQTSNSGSLAVRCGPVTVTSGEGLNAHSLLAT